MRRGYGLAIALSIGAAATIGACSIGPKQDDPIELPPGGNEPTNDGGLSADTGRVDETGAMDGIDAAADAPDADAPADTKSETCPDGGLALEAVGPWHEGKKCWKGVVFFECVDGLDGGTTMTCFTRISTGELFLATTTRIPSGSDYRTCTDAERARVKMMPELCAK